MRRRKAEFLSHLVIIDEPQLFLLKAKKVYFLAVAIPDGVIRNEEYIVVSLSQKNLQRYADGFVDVRYLFTYPSSRRIYSFSRSDWSDGEIMLTPYDDEVPERALPSPGLFSDSHTEDYFEDHRAHDQETLHIDGEWELDDFGRFYRKYSDIYYTAATLHLFSDRAQSRALKGKTKKVFSDKPYKGGTSYMHMFEELYSCIPKDHRLGLDGISYNSPGDVKILGDQKSLSSVEFLILHFLKNRKDVVDAYQDLRAYLSQVGYLKTSAKEFVDSDPYKPEIDRRTENLVRVMQFPYYQNLREVCNNNSLVVAKVMLAIHRRVDVASSFFAEGRMAFD